MVDVERDPTSVGCKFKHVITCQCKHVHTSSFVLERERNSRLNMNDLCALWDSSERIASFSLSAN
jgi:hypothetical protein